MTLTRSIPTFLLCGALLAGCHARSAERPAVGQDAKLATGLAAPAEALQIDQTQVQKNTEAYDRIYENPFHATTDQPLSTFAVDVDTASYSNIRRFLRDGQLPPKDAVRIEELVNYFNYDYPAPDDGQPFSATTEVAACPWNARHRLVHVGLQARRVETASVPARNLVFLLDVSGSMNSARKLPLLKSGLKLVVDGLRDQDRVAIVVYAGASGLALPSTSGAHKDQILDALTRLRAGGSTNGGAGIELAYSVAEEHFVRGGINRVILATDGDFNVGVTNRGDLTRLIERKRDSGVFLTVLGFGTGNIKDSTMEELSNKGNGNYAYIDGMAEARKVLVNEAGGTLVTVAKDVKVQVEFNPLKVSAYRLIGYENRLLAARDFNDDKKDAGEIGAGHSVTALYEVVPVGVREQTGDTDPLKYSKPGEPTAAAKSDDLLTLKVRYKAPDASDSELLTFAVRDGGADLAAATPAFRFSAAVAAYGMLLRGSEHRGNATFAMVRQLAAGARGIDAHGYRKEFVRLAQLASELKEATQ